MMKKAFIKIFFSSVILLIASCTDLDEIPKDFPSPENYYNSPSQIEASLTSSMARLYRPWDNYGYGNYFALGNDDQIRGGELVLDSNHGNSVWRSHYLAIADLNPIFGALDEDRLGSTVSQEIKDELRGYAKFLRAYNYFTLVRLYGDVPLITEKTNVATDEISRVPIAEVYAFIVEELKFAIENLPESWPDAPGKAVSGVAKGLLAKVYLTMASAPLNDTSKWALARDMATDVMNDGIYSLVPEIEEVFNLANEHGPEMMFIFEATEDDPSTPPQIWLPGHMANGWTDFSADRVWHEAYPDQPRKNAYLLLEDWDGVHHLDWPNGAGFNIRKFLYDTRENLERLTSTQGIPILRYADIVLIFAEAENMANGGPTPAAVDALNSIIDRANGGVVNLIYPRATLAMGQSEFDVAVINERNLELCFEFDRWYDLIRKRILCEMVRPEVQGNCDENDYLFPIPQTELRLNPLMVQNPGYPAP